MARKNAGQEAARSTPANVVPFVPLEWQIGAWNDTSPVMLLTGSAGGGKSRIALEKIHAFLLKYPGSNALIMRKRLEDTKRSLLPVLDDYVIVNARALGITKNVSNRRYVYEHRNRRGAVRNSYLWWGGIYGEKERMAIRSIGSSGGLDIAFMEEGIEYEEEDFDEVSGRLRAQAAPWNQLIVNTNPGPPGHWINRRLIIGGEASVHLSSAADNPHVPPQYIARLNSMTGIMGARLARGEWVEGTGLVIDTWSNVYNQYTGEDKDGNVSLKAEYDPHGGPIILAADDGYAGEYDTKAKMFTQQSHPRVFLLAQQRPNGQICVFAESYEIKMLYTRHLDLLRELCDAKGWPFPQEAHYDKASATLRASLADYGIASIFPSTSLKDESISLLRDRVGPDENGFRSILVHPRCRNLIGEFGSYSYINGLPAKYWDHGIDALRYLAWNLLRGISNNNAIAFQTTSIDIQNRIEQKMREVDTIMNHLNVALPQL